MTTPDLIDEQSKLPDLFVYYHAKTGMGAPMGYGKPVDNYLVFRNIPPIRTVDDVAALETKIMEVGGYSFVRLTHWQRMEQ